MQPIYDSIGENYDLGRQADPSILQELIDCLAPIKGMRYLDLGCGTGNYTCALSDKNIQVEGLDVSSLMLEQAKKKNPELPWYQGDARNIPLPSNTFHGMTCTFALHHMSELDAVFSEVYRVLHKGRLVILDAYTDSLKHFWLNHYFPKTLNDRLKKTFSLQEVEQHLRDTGFNEIWLKPCVIDRSIKDNFLFSGIINPEIYLDSNIRKSISTLRLSPYQDEIKQGVKQLKHDIDSGRINDIMADYDSRLAEIFFVVAEK
jgi:ubiquinone/menaquinone biosynthesis C-methylase UbiE